MLLSLKSSPLDLPLFANLAIRSARNSSSANNCVYSSLSLSTCTVAYCVISRRLSGSCWIFRWNL